MCPLPCKLMRFDRPWAKFRLKSDSNRLLIDLFDPISAAQYTRCDDLIGIPTKIRSKKSIYIKNQSKLIKIFQF